MEQQEKRIREVMAAWRSLAELAAFAGGRHGYSNSDGGFGVTYPDDLDGYEREVESRVIPEGTVEVYGYWGHPDGYEFVVSETHYLAVLAQVLRESNLTQEAVMVERLIDDCA